MRLVVLVAALVLIIGLTSSKVLEKREVGGGELLNGSKSSGGKANPLECGSPIGCDLANRFVLFTTGNLNQMSSPHCYINPKSCMFPDICYDFLERVFKLESETMMFDALNGAEDCYINPKLCSGKEKSLEQNCSLLFTCRICNAMTPNLSSATGYNITRGAIKNDATGCKEMTLTCAGPSNPTLRFYDASDKLLGYIYNDGATINATLSCFSKKWGITLSNDGAITPTLAECTGSVVGDGGFPRDEIDEKFLSCIQPAISAKLFEKMSSCVRSSPAKGQSKHFQKCIDSVSPVFISRFEIPYVIRSNQRFKECLDSVSPGSGCNNTLSANC